MRALLNDKKIKNIIMAILIGVCILIISWPSDKSSGTSGNAGVNGTGGTNGSGQYTGTGYGTSGNSGSLYNNYGNSSGNNTGNFIGTENNSGNFGNSSGSSTGNYSSTGNNSDSNSATGSAQADAYIDSKEPELKALLEKVSGVGSVEVMITLEDDGEDIVLRDSTGEISSEADASRSSSSTSAVEGSNGDPYVVRNVKPQIKGVVVACEGGGDPEVALKISEAVQALFGLPAHKIVVLEIK